MIDGLVDIMRTWCRCLGIDSRRPASWLGMAFAAAAACWLVREGTDRPDSSGLAPLAGAAAALAACGDLPAAGSLWRSTPRLLAAATASRLAWPFCGAAVTSVWLEALSGPTLALAMAVVAAGLTNVVLRLRGADAAEASGTSLAAAAAASITGVAAEPIGAGWGGGVWGGAWLVLCVAAAWGMVLLMAISWLAAEHRAAPWPPTTAMETIGWPAASGRLGSGLFAAGMIAALLGMATWLFLMPERWTWYRGLAAIWFVVLAVPRATLAWGAVGASGRRRILASTARSVLGTGVLASRLEWCSGLPPLGPEWRVSLAAVAILGWPPLVAAGVVGGAEAVERIGLVAALAAWGTALTLITTITLRCGGGRETAQAVALTVAGAWFAVVGHLERPETPRNEVWNGVEESGASCETPRQRRSVTRVMRPYHAAVFRRGCSGRTVARRFRHQTDVRSPHVRGTLIALRNTSAAIAIVAAAAVAGAADPSRAEGLASSETVFPASTRAWFSVPDARGLRQRFDRSPYGQLLADPAMDAFVEHVRGQINANSKQRLAKLGLTLEDLERIPGGEVAAAAIEPEAGRLVTVLFVDTTGHETEARELVETITSRLVERKATPVTIAGAPAGLSVYRLPPEAADERRTTAPRERRVAFAIGGSVLVVGDDAQQVGQAFSVATTGRKDSLAATAPFAGVMERCARNMPGEAAPIRWFVEPLAFAKAYRESNPPVEKRKGPDYVEILGRQGFDAIKGLGGIIVFGAGGHAVRHATMVWAPPLPGRTPLAPDSFDLAARMLQFPNADRLVPPDWVPRDVTGWTTLRWNLQSAFAASETLVDDIVGDRGVFDDVIASLKEDPDGPQIDVEKDLVAALGTRVSLITDHADPADPDAERLVIAVEAVDEARVAATIAKVMGADKDMERKEIAGHVVWELIDRTAAIPELQIETPGLGLGGDRDRDDDGRRRRQRIREKEEKLLPHSSVTVAKGHLFIASHRDVLERVLLTPGGIDALESADDYAAATAEIDRLLPGSTALKSFGREDKTILPAYELLRRGSMPKSQSVMGQLLNALLADGKPGSVREQRIDGSTLPDFEQIRRYFGTAAVGMEAVADGWFVTGLSLPRATQEPEVARTPDTTAIGR